MARRISRPCATAINNVSSQLAAALSERDRIERELGQGMATVYLAQDLKHDRKVALKVLKPELAAVLGAERFVQEIRTTTESRQSNGHGRHRCHGRLKLRLAERLIDGRQRGGDDPVDRLDRGNQVLACIAGQA